MESYKQQLNLPVPAAEAYAWHCRPGALQRLLPPWESVQIVDAGKGVSNDSIITLKQHLGPFRLPWLAKHHDCRPGRSFSDTQLSGPFAYWEHLHHFEDEAAGQCVLTDQIEYRLPGGICGRLLGSRFVKRKLQAMFAYRHRTTRDDLIAHAKYSQQAPLRVAVTGAGGLVGSALVPLLTTGAHEVVRLVRKNPNPADVQWDPQAESWDASGLGKIDVVVHLAGENIAGGRWSEDRKRRIRSSRVQGTRVLCAGLAKLASPPRVLLCASGVGYYGDRGAEKLTEQSAVGSGFLAELAQDWEAATAPARDAGIRVVHLRFGMILSPRGGALAKMLLPFQLGCGGRVGTGRQYWSWISVDDAAGAIQHAMLEDSLRGPINVVAPQAVTNAEFTRILGRVLKRPTILPLPAWTARAMLGEMADELLLASTRVEPCQLMDSDYQFRQPDLRFALEHLLGRAMPQESGSLAMEHK